MEGMFFFVSVSIFSVVFLLLIPFLYQNVSLNVCDGSDDDDDDAMMILIMNWVH